MKSVEEEEVSFDISNAAVNSDFPLGEGDEVSVHFYVDEAAEKQEAIEVDVNYSTAEEDYEGDAVITCLLYTSAGWIYYGILYSRRENCGRGTYAGRGM